MFELLQRWLARYARSSWAPRRIGTVAAVLALLVVAVVVTAVIAGGGSNSRSRTAAHVPIDTTGSPATFVRDVLLASYSGDAADVCAQLTPQALAQLALSLGCCPQPQSREFLRGTLRATTSHVLSLGGKESRPGHHDSPATEGWPSAMLAFGGTHAMRV
jgi:hypothetical protein